MTRTKRWLGSLAMLTTVAGVSANIVSAQVTPAPAQAPDAAAVGALVKSMDVALTALPAGAGQPDGEATLTYIIDQARQPDDVVVAALQQLRALKEWPDPIGKAIDAVLTRRGATGGVGDPNSLLGAGPGVGTSGGGTDYTGN